MSDDMQMPVEADTSTWTYMPWVDEYIMQNKRLTKEHYRLVFFTNKLQYLLNEMRESDARQFFIDEIAPLARQHLRFEILVMNTIDYQSINPDGYAKHCEAHAKLGEGIEVICKNIDTQNMSDVSAFLKDWLDNHIKKDDVQYNAEIIKLGISNG